MPYEYDIIGNAYPDGDEENRRWSVNKKLESRYYCRIRSCQDFFNALRLKCFFSTSIFILFIVLVVASVHTYLLSFGLLNTEEHDFDFIVVGAGPSGSVVARKLSDAGHSVLLLEAGGPTQYDLGGTDTLGAPVTQFDIPLFWSSLSQYPEHIWKGFKMANVLLGKGLGGCGVLNAMIYVRCTPGDVSRWGMQALEQGGWSWSNVLRAYKAIESFVPESETEAEAVSGQDEAEGASKHSSFHGDGSRGPSLRTTRPPSLDPFSELFLSSALAANMSLSKDFNDPQGGRGGVGLFHFNLQGGVRHSAAAAFLGPALRGRQGGALLNISLHSEVRKVLFDKKDARLQHEAGKAHASFPPKAIGVEYVRDGIVQRAYLNRHFLETEQSVLEGYAVILAAGAIHTPKILLNSGVGAAEKVRQGGSEGSACLVAELPGVGRNLQDHPTVNVKFEISSSAGVPSAYDLVQSWRGYHEAVQAARRGATVPPSKFGVLGGPGFSSGAFLRSPLCSSDDPDIQLTFFPSSAEPYLEPLPEGHSGPQVLVEVTLMSADARYELVLDPSAPLSAPPLIRLGDREMYLSERDTEVLAWGVSQVRLIASQLPLSAHLAAEVSPGPEVGSEKELRRWAREHALPNSHWAGTAKMGLLNDSSAVVDGHLRVRGVRNLRVADASIFPLIPNGNVHSSVVMVASRAADLILDQIDKQGTDL